MKRYEVKRIYINWYGIWDNVMREYVIDPLRSELKYIVKCSTAKVRIAWSRTGHFL